MSFTPSHSENVRDWTGRTPEQHSNDAFRSTRRKIAKDYHLSTLRAHAINFASLVAVAVSVGVLLAALLGGL